jgi:hypothetical protein
MKREFSVLKVDVDERARRVLRVMMNDRRAKRETKLEILRARHAELLFPWESLPAKRSEK